MSWSEWAFLQKLCFFCQVFLLVLFSPSFFSGDLIKRFGKSNYFCNSFDLNSQTHLTSQGFSYIRNAWTRLTFHSYSNFCIKIINKTSSFTYKKQVFLRTYTQYFILFIKLRHNFVNMCQFLKFGIMCS